MGWNYSISLYSPTRASATTRVPFETSFDSRQPKLEPKLVLALSETKCLFRFYTKTESFDVSIEPKQTKDQPKQFDRELILVFFRKFRVGSKQFCLFWLFWYRFETPKQTKHTETNQNTTETDLVSVCFGGSNRNFVCLFRGHPSNNGYGTLSRTVNLVLDILVHTVPQK